MDAAVLTGAAITLVVSVVAWVLGEVSRKREWNRAAQIRREDLKRQDRLHLLDARKDAYADCLGSLLRFQQACAQRHAGLRDDESASDVGLSRAFDTVVTTTARARLLRRDTATEEALDAVESAAGDLLGQAYWDALIREDLEPLIKEIKEPIEGPIGSNEERGSPANARQQQVADEDAWESAMQNMRETVQKFTKITREELDIAVQE